MDATTLSTSSLRQLIKLTEKRESLQAALAKVEQDIYLKINGTPTPTVRTPKKASKVKSGKRGRRGAVKEQIVAALHAAGSKGVFIKDLSSKLGIKNQNVHVWFATTGKTIKGLKKTGPGHFTLSS